MYGQSIGQQTIYSYPYIKLISYLIQLYNYAKLLSSSSFIASSFTILRTSSIYTITCSILRHFAAKTSFYTLSSLSKSSSLSSILHSLQPKTTRSIKSSSSVKLRAYIASRYAYYIQLYVISSLKGNKAGLVLIVLAVRHQIKAQYSATYRYTIKRGL